jgi:hypothetical protein
MKGKRHSPEQIVRKLREAGRLLAEGADADAVCRHLQISVQTYQRRRAIRPSGRCSNELGSRGDRSPALPRRVIIRQNLENLVRTG